MSKPSLIYFVGNYLTLSDEGTFIVIWLQFEYSMNAQRSGEYGSYMKHLCWNLLFNWLRLWILLFIFFLLLNCQTISVMQPGHVTVQARLPLSRSDVFFLIRVKAKSDLCAWLRWATGKIQNAKGTTRRTKNWV